MLDSGCAERRQERHADGRGDEEGEESGDEAALQAEHAAMPFAATLVRFRGGTWRVVLTPEQWAAYVRLLLREGLL